ncbi:hypothetical protein KAX02_02975 [candidate division WOR-3 bacterium]|nr:hypothetical protein [candidate division WOR-3 bacterium]
MSDKKQIENILIDQIMNGEISVSEQNQEFSNSEFEEIVGLLDGERREKNYDWNSDISLPEFASHQLTQSSIDVGQYFQTRDFVEVYLEDESDEAKANSNAAKELINRTLNRRDLHHYLKFVRGKSINNIIGRVYAKCWWEQKTKTEIVDYKTRYEDLDVDIYGDPLVSEEQVPAQKEIVEPVYGKVPIIDRFNYDIWDQRNVFTDNSYVYSLQDKQFVIFRSEMTLSQLKAVENMNGYFNLELLKDIKPPEKTKFQSKAADKDQNTNPITSSIEKPYDIYERYGKVWILDGEIGLDKEGKPLDKAEMEEIIVTIAQSGQTKTLIGFKKTPYIDAEGQPYRPIIRGLCYVHLTEDGGVGDGKYSKELQIGIDDTFNISQDRVMLATLPTIAVNKHALDDNSTLYFEPGHPMELNDPQKDVKEFQISDNISGALAQISMLTGKMQQVDSIQPPSMGDTGQASTTATAFAGAYRATGERVNYKSLTFENTFLCDLYWMIQQMTYVFAFPETGLKLMGDKIYEFDPSKDYYYKPLSQSIEPEYSKANKRKEWATLFGYAAQIPHPDTVKMVNYIFGEYVKLMGDEHANFADKFLDEKQPIQQQGGIGAVPNQGIPMSNQAGMPQSSMEQNARGMTLI